jgi:hypothetical protein
MWEIFFTHNGCAFLAHPQTSHHQNRLNLVDTMPHCGNNETLAPRNGWLPLSQSLFSFSFFCFV